MQTVTALNDKTNKEKEALELRPEPVDARAVSYVAWSPDRLRSEGIRRFDVLPYLKRGWDVEMHVLYREVEVDGELYVNTGSVYTPSFYNFRPVQDENSGWSRAFVYSTICHFCKKDWQMSDERYLRTGSIVCAHCGSYDNIPWPDGA